MKRITILGAAVLALLALALIPASSAHAAPTVTDCTWHTLAGSAQTFRDPGGEGSGVEALTVSTQLCGPHGATARTVLTVQAERDHPYRGTLLLALCLAHGLGPLAYCDGPPLTIAQVALVLAEGMTATRTTSAAKVTPGCNLSYGIPYGVATDDLISLAWDWHSRGVCPSGSEGEDDGPR